MKIIHCTDLHGHEARLAWLVSTAKHFDLICLTGDFLDLTDYKRIETQIQKIHASLESIPVPVAVCSGNNDSFAGNHRLFQASWLKELKGPQRWGDGERSRVGTISFRCIAWNAIIAGNGDDDIWLAHAPPAFAPTAINRVDGQDCGDVSLRELCRAGRGPAIVLSGHQHDPVKWVSRVGKTWSFNPGCNAQSEVPNFVVIDTNRHVGELFINEKVHDSIDLTLGDAWPDIG